MSQMLCRGPTGLGESFSLPAILQERCYLFSCSADQESDALKGCLLPLGSLTPGKRLPRHVMEVHLPASPCSQPPWALPPIACPGLDAAREPLSVQACEQHSSVRPGAEPVPSLLQGCPSDDHKGGCGPGESTQPRVRQNCGFDFTLPPTCSVTLGKSLPLSGWGWSLHC